MARKFSGRLALLAVIGTLTGLVGAASPARADLLGSVLGVCSSATSQPFAPWGDGNAYTLAPNGAFESGTTAWSLAGGSSVVGGNETYYVHGSADAHSLRLPTGATAFSSITCGGTLGLDARFFAQNVGGDGTLHVQVIYRGFLGNVISVLDRSAVSAGPSWGTPPSIVLLGGLTAPLGTASVQMRFVAVGGDWRIDDVYVDPMKIVG